MGLAGLDEGFDFGGFAEVFFFRVGLVENVELFAFEVDAADAISTTEAVIAVETMIAVFAVLEEGAVVAAVAVEAVVTKFAFEDVVIVDAVAAFVDAPAVVGVFAKAVAYQKIAVFIVFSVGAIFAILVVDVEDCGMGDFGAELLEFLEEVHGFTKKSIGDDIIVFVVRMSVNFGRCL